MSKVKEPKQANVPGAGWEAKYLRKIRKECEKVGLVKTASDRWSDPADPKVYVESGYVMGEVKVDIKFDEDFGKVTYRVRTKDQLNTALASIVELIA